MASSESRPNPSQDGTPDSSPRKFKRYVEALEELLKASIVVKAHPPNLSVKPRSLQPLMLLPREHLQLSFLDLSSPYGSFESSKCYESNIKILDLEGRMGSRPVVLVARLETDKTIYAIERRKNGLYTLCHFGSWVDLQELEKLAIAAYSQLIVTRLDISADSNSNASLPLVTPQLHHDSKKRRLAIEAIQSLVRRPSRSLSISTTSQLIPPTGPPTPAQDSSAESRPTSSHIPGDVLPTEVREVLTEGRTTKAAAIDEFLAAPTAQGIFDNIRSQYLESLYHSMGSLAYFAKGPLSRARATFHLDCDANLEMNDLIDFLKSLVMTTSQIDKKYRESIPDIMSKMKSTFEDSDVENGTAKAKKRKARKMKLGKDGLYPMEDGHVRQWWTARKPQYRDEEEAMTRTEPQDAKLQVAWLRSRETQLQMIIILEILALEPLVTPRDDGDSQLPGLATLDDPATKTPIDMPTRKRCKHDLPSLVDVHADRLCIWQSTSLDDMKLPDHSQRNEDLESQKSLRATSDPLKDFCVDIIVPFFSARLPEKTDSINRKLGGPIMLPPSKPKQKKQEKTDSTMKPKSKPISVAKRPGSSKSKTLESVLSKESEKHRRSMSRGPSGVIALMRSASTPMLKREASEPMSMTNIPKADSVASQDKAPRPPMPASTKRISEEDKAKKDARVRAELHDAITALRRPNREVVVGKAMAEAAERQAITSLSSLRKSRKPTQYPRPRDIVKATPVGNRFKDVLGMGASKQSTYSQAASLEATPPSSMIPSSAPRKRSHGTAFTLDESPDVPHFMAPANQVKATPVRSSTLKQSFLRVPEADDAILASSPIMARKSSQTSFRDSGIMMPSSPAAELAETPIKQRAVSAPQSKLVLATPVKRIFGNETFANSGKATGGNKRESEKKTSIYDRLGWDDDFDELG